MNAQATIALWNQIAAVWLESAVRGLFTVLVVAVICALVERRLSASLRCWLWWLVCARLVFVVAGGLVGLPLLHIPVPIPHQVLPSVSALHAFPNGLGADANPALPGNVSSAAANAATTHALTKNEHPTLAAYALLFWSIGVLIALTRASVESRRLYNRLRTARDLSATPLGGEMRELAVQMGIAAPPRIVESAATSAPFVVGLWRPVLVIPAGLAESLSPEEGRMTLAHELAHLRRGDIYLALVPFAARVLCFCVPLLPARVGDAWSTAREADCDARAIAITQAAPGVYSQLLLKIVRRDAVALPASLTILGATASFHTLQMQLQLIRTNSHPRRMRLAFLPLFALLALCIATPWHLIPTQARTTDSRHVAGLTLAPLNPLPAPPGASDIADILAFDTCADADPDKHYILIGDGTNAAPPPHGYHLLVVLPGGDGSADFNFFVRRLQKRALGERYIVAELVAKQWDAKQAREVVWPTQTNPWPTMRFSTEQFVDAVVRDVEARFPIDRRQVLSLSWASGGPAGYAASMAPNTPIQGTFVAMSVFRTDALPPLAQAKGRTYFLLHPENAPIVPVAIAHRAQVQLQKNGANVELVTYPGNYGWHGDVYAQVRRGIHSLEERTAKPAE